jgi:hypothetical protein
MNVEHTIQTEVQTEVANEFAGFQLAENTILHNTTQSGGLKATWQYLRLNNHYEIRQIAANSYEIRKHKPKRLKTRGDKIQLVKHNPIAQALDKKSGYYVVYLDGRRESIHHLVATQYIDNDDPEFKFCVNHINHKRTDNRISNLRWATPEQIARDKGYGKKRRINITPQDDFETQHPNLIAITNYGDHEFDNLFYCPDVRTFYLYLPDKHEFHQLRYRTSGRGYSFVNATSTTNVQVCVYQNPIERLYVPRHQ